MPEETEIEKFQRVHSTFRSNRTTTSRWRDRLHLTRRPTSASRQRSPVPAPVSLNDEYGLRTIFEPPDGNPIAEFVFVHGLGGGSRTTWSSISEPQICWPELWLPQDPDFQGVRLHTFGYNANWAGWHRNPLDVHAFGEALLEDLYGSPEIKGSRTPIVLIGHNIGGLVIKKTCIKAKTSDTFYDIAERLHSLYFLGTPHRGSNQATTLNNILHATGMAQRPAIPGLESKSETIRILNDDFRHHYQGINLHTFYERVPMPPTGMIVDPESATLGYAEERPQLLNADHLHLTKFVSVEDANYKSLRNRLTATVEDIRLSPQSFIPEVDESTFQRSPFDAPEAQLERIKSYLKIDQQVEDILTSLEDTKLPGSCGWLTEKKEFQSWRKAESPRYFWLRGPPTCGKSMLASHVIYHLRGAPTCYYFFKSREKIRPELSSFLQAMAYQMAKVNTQAREALLKLSEQEAPLDNRNYRSLWHSLFAGCIFNKSFRKIHYWVIDALDEAVESVDGEAGKSANTHPLDEWFSLLSKVDDNIPLKIFITSRPSKSLENLFSRLPTTMLQVTPEDSQNDIHEYVKSLSSGLPVSSNKAREDLISKIVKKAGGSFLWTVLVMRQLHDVNTEEEIRHVLAHVPLEMSDLYRSNIKKMEGAVSKTLAKHIITWVICAVQPLSTDQMKEAIQLSLNTTIARDLRGSLQYLCGQFLDVDKHSKIQVVHETARAFLLDPDLDSELRVDLSEGHLMIATACLKYLLSDDIKYSKRRRSAVSNKPTRESVAGYACLHFSEHVHRASSADQELFDMLQRFFYGNVLAWIEHVTRLNELDRLVHASRHLANYLRRRSKYIPLVRGDMHTWTVDLPRIVTQFGANIMSNPASIHTLVPPFCPRTSAIFKQFGATKDGIELVGTVKNHWEDRICSISYHHKYATTIACRDQSFAVALDDGSIKLYRASTCEEIRTFSEGDRVVALEFGTTSKLLATASLKCVKLWNTEQGVERFTIPLESRVLDFAFNEEDSRLIVASGDHVISIFRTSDGSLEQRDSWADRLIDADDGEIPRSPQDVHISTPQQVMAVIYRSRPVQLFTLEQHCPIQPIGSCVRPTTHKHDNAQHIIHSAMINPNPAYQQLVVSYWDNVVVVYDIYTCNPLVTVTASLDKIAISPNGKSLAGSENDGSITIFDFQTLQAIRHIRCYADPVAALVFTSNSLRVLEVRGTQANMWEPSVLVSQDSDTGAAPSETVSGTSEDSESLGIDQPTTITVLRCCEENGVAFWGRSNGKVEFCRFYDPVASTKSLYSHRGSFTSITDLDWNSTSRIIVSADSSGRFRVARISKDWEAALLLEQALEQGCAIDQVLMSACSQYFMVSSPELDSVWSIKEKARLATARCARRASWKWFNSPKLSSHLILFENRSLDLFNWSNLAKLSNSDDTSTILARAGLNSHIDADSICIADKELIFGEKVSPSQRSLSQNGTTITKFYTHNLSFDGQQQPLHSREPPRSRHIADIPDVDRILGMVSIAGYPHVVFLSRKGWVCSIKLSGKSSVETFQQHFFIPSVWRTTAPVLLSKVRPNGDIVFVYGGGIVIVKNGLTTENTYSVSIL